MKKERTYGDFIARLSIKLLLGVVILFIIIVFNQSVQIVEFMSRIHPFLGNATILLLVIIFAVFILIPILSLLSYKALPELPENEESEEYIVYLSKLKSRLERNTFIKKNDFKFDQSDLRTQIITCHSILDKEAKILINEKATGVFLTTAISQNGILDGFFVLSTLSKLIWELSKLYEVRPSYRKLLSLYINVGATVLMARGIEDLDLIDEQLEPIMTTLLGGSFASLVPGAVSISNLVVNSITEGAVNTLLTLRVGCIAKAYLEATVKPNRRMLRRSATIEACSLLGSIMKDNSIKLASAITKGVFSKTKSAFKNTFRW